MSTKLQNRIEFLSFTIYWQTNIKKQLNLYTQYLFPPVLSLSLSQYSDENMMDSYNLAICFGPTLMPIPDGQDPVACQAHVNEVIKTIIMHNELIFPSQRELDGPVYEKCMTGGDEYWWVLAGPGSRHVSKVLCWWHLRAPVTTYQLLLSICSHSDSPHSEPGTIDEADNGTEPHTSDEGQYIIVFIFNLPLWRGICITLVCFKSYSGKTQGICFGRLSIILVLYLNKCLIDWNEIGSWHSWSSEDESFGFWSSDFTSSTTSMFTFEMSGQQSDGLSRNFMQLTPIPLPADESDFFFLWRFLFEITKSLEKKVAGNIFYFSPSQTQMNKVWTLLEQYGWECILCANTLNFNTHHSDALRKRWKFRFLLSWCHVLLTGARANKHPWLLQAYWMQE